MKSSIVVLLAVLVSACAYTNPTQPDATVFDAAAPVTLSLNATAGTGPQGGTASIVARVQNGHGTNLPHVPVTFTTDHGSLSTATAETIADGTATLTLTSATPAVITATAGPLIAHASIHSNPTVPVVSPGPGGPEPTPPGPPAPLPLTVTMNVTAGPTGSATSFSLSMPCCLAQAVWTFGDGASATSTIPTMSHVYTVPGAYTASVTITDTIGRTASNSQTFAIATTPPPPPYLVTLSAAPTTILVGAASTLTASVIRQNGAPVPTAYAWTFGDSTGSTTTTASTSHVYAKAGSFSASVTATGGTASGSGSTTVTVTAAIPVITVSCSTGIHTGQVSSCVVSATLNTAVVPSASITHVDWDFGDGALAATSGNVSPGHTYGTSATYLVQAIATVTGGTGPGTGTVNTTILP